MSISYEDTGRRNQKARTRAALIDAARDLLASGLTPTVEETAEAASISRATAYRYFPNRHALLVAAHPEVEATSLLGAEPPVEPEARLDIVVTGLAEMFLDAEKSYRAMLRLSLEPDAADRGELALRKGRRFIWIEDALEPLRDRLPAAEFERLVHAVAAVVGIEALVTLTDLAGMSRARAVEVMRWSARALLRAATDGAEKGRGRA
jgi:AcrR family transcriptional regulator